MFERVVWYPLTKTLVAPGTQGIPMLLPQHPALVRPPLSARPVAIERVRRGIGRKARMESPRIARSVDKFEVRKER
jgi:hypothetical protein